MGPAPSVRVAAIGLAAAALINAWATADRHQSTRAACPPALDWEKASSSRVTYHSAENRSADLVFIRHTNGLYVKAGAKEMYQLRNGIELFRGLEEKDWTFPGPFFMVEMPAFMPIAFVAQRFPDASSVPDRLTAFEYVMPRGNPLGIPETRVAGVAHRDGGAISYDLKAVETRERPAVIDASGVLDLGPRAPIPADADFTGWEIAERRSNPDGWTPLPRPPGVKTIGDLYALEPEQK